MTIIFLSTPSYFLLSLLFDVWSCLILMIGYLDAVSHGSGDIHTPHPSNLTQHGDNVCPISPDHFSLETDTCQVSRSSLK